MSPAMPRACRSSTRLPPTARQAGASRWQWQLSASRAGEVRLALLAERGERLALVVGRAAHVGEAERLLPQPVLEVVVKVALQDALARADRDRRQRRDLLGQLDGALEELVVGVAQSVEESDPIGLVGVDIAAGEDEVGGAAVTDDAGQEPAHPRVR